MLKLRVITALLLAPSVVAAVLYLDTHMFAVLMGAVITLAAWEWANISRLSSALMKGVFALVICLTMLGIYLAGNESVYMAVTFISVLFWLLAVMLVMAFQKSIKGHFKLPVQPWYFGPFVLVPAWTSLVLLHRHEPDGAEFVLMLMVLVWIADIAAYFSGKKWGKTKLCDKVSPGKSREGVYGALIGVAIAAFTVALSKQLGFLDVLVFVAICLFCIVASIVGDLFESLVKRLGDVKDSGNILPGHGGILDRIDSLTAALPVFVTSLWLWEKAA